MNAKEIPTKRKEYIIQSNMPILPVKKDEIYKNLESKLSIAEVFDTNKRKEFRL